jgi:hypothetical protein
VFIVVMVITLLTAIGIFAARSASMVDAAAGYDRQSLQAHYLAELGGIAVATELGTPTASAYIQQMKRRTDTCRMTKNFTSPDGSRAPCYMFVLKELAARTGRTLIERAADGPPTIPGSLGPYPPSTKSALEGNFVVELTDPGPASVPVAGADVGETGPSFKYEQVALTATGQVRPLSGAAICDTASAGMTGIESMRAHVILGPLPR